MTAPTTYASALAACVERWGAPTWSGVVCGSDYAEWTSVGTTACRSVAGRDAAVWMDTSVGLGVTLVGATWTLAGEPTARAPLTPIPDALDAADAWVAAKGGGLR